MSQPHIFFAEVNERQGVFHRRAVLFGGLTGAGLAALGGRLAYLQLLETQRYEKLATSNQFNFKLLPAPRGLIVDRNGAVLAANRPNFRLMVARDKGVDPEATLKILAGFVPLDDARQRRLLRVIHNAPKRAPVQVMEDMSWEQFSAINVRAPELPGVTADMGEVRVYPHGGAFVHVIGYVAKVNKEDVAAAGAKGSVDPIMLHPSFRIGKQGVEKAFDADLRGKAGAQKVEVDANGREVRQDAQGDIPSVPGKVIELTLDIDVQLRAEEVFGAESGAAVVMDCRNGDILCMYSGPSFDANRFVRGLTGAEYRALAGYDHKPLFNKALTATYPPGSTFKTMVALAALEHGYDPATVHVCSGRWSFGRVWKCDQVHGAQDLKSAVATSCDIYFYQCALAIGPDKIAETARKFGLGEIFDIGIPGQKRGLVPDTAYKRRTFPKDPKWHPGETPSMGIGQGYTHLNPLQLCVMASRIANGRKALHPRLIRSIGGIEQKSGAAWGDLDVGAEHLAFLREAMKAVTTVGTAARVADLGLGPIKMAGKTGTAQAYSYGAGRGVHGTAGAWGLRDHAWFVAYAPYDDPRYAISVLVEHGGFGAAAAAPRAREIMRTVLLKDPEVLKRVESPVPLPDLPPEIQTEDDLPEAPTPLPVTPGARPA